METTGHILNSQPIMRSPPPSGPTPLYAKAVRRFIPYSLRPVIIFSSLLSAAYLLILGISDFRASTRYGNSGKLKTFDIIQGALFLAAAIVELIGFQAAYSQRLSLARLYSFGSLIAFAAVVASEIIGIIVNTTLKSDVIGSCTTYYTGSMVSTGWFGSSNNNSSTPWTEAQASDYCQSLWSSNRTWDYIWLFITFFLGAAFVTFSFAYVRQLIDPNSVQERRSRLPFHRQRQTELNGPYDPDAAFSYPPGTGSYQPPPGPPPPMGPSGVAPPPTYTGRDSFDDEYDGDVKSPAAYGYGYNYGPNDSNPFSNRPGSSRNVAMHPEEEDEDPPRKDSGETLRGEDTVKKVASTQGHGHDEHEDDNTPRI